MPMYLADLMAWLRSRLAGLHARELSLESRNILYLTLDTAVQGLMMGGIFSFLSVFVVRLGATKLQTTLLTSLPAIMLVLTSIPAGQIVQRQRDLVRFTNFVRIFHRGGVLLMALLPFLANDHLITIIIVVWTIKALSNALLESSWMAVVAEVIPAHRRARVNGMRWTILSVVTAISVAIFGYLLDSLPFPLNYQVVFMISFVGGSIGMFYWGKLTAPGGCLRRGSGGRPSLREQVRAYWRSLQVPAFVRYEMATSVLRIGIQMPAALYSIYWIRELAATDTWIGWQTTTSQVATIVGYTLWGRVISRKGYFGPLLICSAGLGLYPILTGLIPTPMWLPLVSIVQGFFMTGVNIAFFDTLLAVCPSDRRPSLIATNTMVASLAIFAAPLLGSFLAEQMHIRTVFFIAGGIHIASAVIFWLLRIAAASPAPMAVAQAGAAAELSE
jgi:MFS family permease